MLAKAILPFYKALLINNYLFHSPGGTVLKTRALLT